MSEQHDLARIQTLYLESLGVYQRGFSPDGCYGRGRIQYRDEDLANRMSWHGFQSYQLRHMFTGEIAMTTRTALRLAKASHGSYENKDPNVTVRMLVVTEL